MTASIENSPAAFVNGRPPAMPALFERFVPVFDQIAAGAVARETERTLAHDAVKLLAESGFTAVRVPVEYGGSGVGISQLFTLLARLGEADSNLVQALRAHFATVESFLLADEAQRERWLPRVVGRGRSSATPPRRRATCPDATARCWRIVPGSWCSMAPSSTPPEACMPIGSVSRPICPRVAVGTGHGALAGRRGGTG